MTDPRPARLHALVYGTGALLLLGHALWLYLMGDYPSILLPVLLTPLMLLAALLRLGQEDHARLSAYLVLICGYLLIAVELPQQQGPAPLWLGLPPVLTLLLLPLGPAMLLNVMLVPIWLMLLGDAQLSRDLMLGYLTLVVVAGLAPWEHLRQQALLRATDPRDPECPAINRLTLKDRLYSECERANLLDQRLAVLLIHLPQLDMASEQFGARARQALLDALCAEVERRCRDHDLLGREGQADFWLVLPDTSENGAMLVRQRLEESLQRTVLLETGPIETRMALCLLLPHEAPEHFEQRLQTRSLRLTES
ncbi:GGDEF domain-containing protein [Halomonas sp. C05BenzN]|uniref:GGDEF domain-containing protein n=1 Tax=Halomonas sp. C05BenzN TaxID=3411041 RepID=UPI003B947FEC